MSLCPMVDVDGTIYLDGIDCFRASACVSGHVIGGLANDPARVLCLIRETTIKLRVFSDITPWHFLVVSSSIYWSLDFIDA